MSDEERRRQELFEVIDHEATDDDERQDSKVLYDALKRRGAEIGGASAIPGEDKDLSERIRSEALRRSEEIRTGSGGSSRSLPFAAERPIPVWLLLGWLVAIAAAAVVLYFVW